MKDELARVLPRCNAADFALGYFFVSGYRQIHDQVSRVPKLRFLISGTTTYETVEAILAGYKSLEIAKNEMDKSTILNPEARKTRIDVGKSEIRESMEVLDPDEESESTIKGLSDLIRSGNLDIRLYVRGTLHAKCYMFHYADPINDAGSAIVGSSNLSIAGLSHNSELNLRTNHPADFERLCGWFEARWDESEPFTDEFLNLLERSWAGGYPYTPKDVYYKALYERVRDRFEADESLEGMLPREFPDLFEYQRLALRQAVHKVRTFNGVIIGDVVGLGKTFIGTALMRTLEQEGYRPLVICPPHLADMWRDFCGKYEVNAKVLSQGMLRQPNYFLSREIEFRDRDLVLIDESHNFRHSDTLQYEKLYQYMQTQNRAAILVTATPLSNSPKDIYNQIRLFHEGDLTRIPISSSNLRAYFNDVEKGNANLSDLLTHIMIRRTRRFIIEHYGVTDSKGRKCLKLQDDLWYFPDRKLDTRSYDVDSTYGKQYETILNLISHDHLTLARYGLYNYLNPKARDKEQYAALHRVGPQLLGLMRKILLKRMESSVGAFRKTIENLTNVYGLFIKSIEAGLVPAGDEQQKLLYDVAREGGATGSDLDSLLQEIAEKSTKYWIGDFEVEALKNDFEQDLNTFSKILELLEPLTHAHDDKLLQLQNLISKISKNKKVLIFTEYADTAKYIDSYIKTDRMRAIAHGGKDGRELERIIQRFSPTYNPGMPSEDKEINLLISTDILSEGMNLQDARVVINYDLHWNPTRLIQRIGRVDRLSKGPMTVDVFNFLPARELEMHLNLESRLRSRIEEIHRVIGEDNKILHPDEQLNEQSMYAIYQKLAMAEEDDGAEAFGLDRVEQELRRLMIDDPEYWQSLIEIPSGIRSAAPIEIEDRWGAVVTCQLGTIQNHYIVLPDREPQQIDWEAVHSLLINSVDESPARLPEAANGLALRALREFKKIHREIGAKKERGMALSPEQRWATEQIARARDEAASKSQIAELSQLFEAYMAPITLPAARKELRRLRRSEIDREGSVDRIVERLKDIYKTYDLGRRDGRPSSVLVTDIPRILYVRLIPVRILQESMTGGQLN